MARTGKDPKAGQPDTGGVGKADIGTTRNAQEAVVHVHAHRHGDKVHTHPHHHPAEHKHAGPGTTPEHHHEHDQADDPFGGH